MFSLPDDWVWDSWIADDGETYHLYFLHSARSPGDPGARHTHARIGHATSTDLVTWTFHGDALVPDEAGTWDDLALWTGSVVRGDDGVWRMFYTALSTRGHGVRDQRIGVVESRDLFTWHRVLDHPAVEVDSHFYATLPEDPKASETWRDPFVFRDPDGDGWHMLITARARDRRPNDDGVLARARSHDLRTWEVGPPACDPGAGFGQLEVPQVHVVDGRAVLVFTCHPQEQTPEHVAAFGEFCTWSLDGTSMTGPWDVTQAQPFVAEPTLFAAPLVQRRDASWALLGFRNQEAQGILSFDLLDPIDVELSGGRLVADRVAQRLPDDHGKRTLDS